MTPHGVNEYLCRLATLFKNAEILHVVEDIVEILTSTRHVGYFAARSMKFEVPGVRQGQVRRIGSLTPWNVDVMDLELHRTLDPHSSPQYWV